MLPRFVDLIKDFESDAEKLAITLIWPFILHLEENYATDKDAKIALIDTIIQMLTQQKQ